MNWGSASDFFAMGGYGLYVWGSMGMCALVVAGELLALAARRRALRELDRDEHADPDHPQDPGVSLSGNPHEA